MLKTSNSPFFCFQESLVKANTASLSKNTGRDSHEKELDSARRHQQEKNRLEVRLKVRFYNSCPC